LADAKIEVPVQFERQGYFCLDKDSTPEKLVFSRTIGLRDTYAKEQGKDQAKEKAAG
jgi:glutaminyl-tRNA synthetase